MVVGAEFEARVDGRELQVSPAPRQRDRLPCGLRAGRIAFYLQRMLVNGVGKGFSPSATLALTRPFRTLGFGGSGATARCRRAARSHLPHGSWEWNRGGASPRAASQITGNPAAATRSASVERGAVGHAHRRMSLQRGRERLVHPTCSCCGSESQPGAAAGAQRFGLLDIASPSTHRITARRGLTARRRRQPAHDRGL